MTELARSIKKGSDKRKKRCITAMVIMGVIAAILAVLHLYLGNTIYSPDVIIRVLMGEEIKGATYAVNSVRLPRMLAGVFSGIAFGMGGYVFQSMLRNQLASPDMIGVTSGSGAAAIICILVLGISGTAASIISVIGGLGVTLLIFVLASRKGFSNGRMILIGIGIQAMLKAVINYVIQKASTYDVPAALRWLSGSLNGVPLKSIPVMAIVIMLCAVVVILFERQLKIIELGDQSAIALGVRIKLIRGTMSVFGVLMLAFSIAVTGPIASVAFLAGPISTRITGKGNVNAGTAALVGILLILGSDLVGQFALGTRFPVGVVTGLLGAPYLLYLLVTMNKKTSV
ncbi:MAG: iron chelate uptake ABC transporter family permease subunit [Oscillospiraceae bacterium]|nr:iron chelate uptake ABC transporter family permease subunit [Oscillospiraceae bacterium]